MHSKGLCPFASSIVLLITARVSPATAWASSALKSAQALIWRSASGSGRAPGPHPAARAAASRRGTRKRRGEWGKGESLLKSGEILPSRGGRGYKRRMQSPATPLVLSVLDQAPIPEGASGARALRNSLDLARLADGLGYRRYWVAEHHATPMLACAAPEVLIGPIAAATSRLRVGSGGVMLPHYSPLKVAESFGMLTALFPGRIDLGIGRAAGTSPMVAYALQRDRRQPAPDDFRDQLDELLALFSNRPVPDKRFLRLGSMHFDSPDVWLLGSSGDSAVWAADLGLPYAFADFI